MLHNCPVQMTRTILCVGLVCVDIVQICKEFPEEDSDQRSLDCFWSRGGNASNNCTVLSLLGAECEFVGAAADNLLWNYTKEDFDTYNINYSNCFLRDGSYDFPLSTVIINARNGTRTIVHSNKNLPEMTADEFSTLDISKYSWIHFEGRNTIELLRMLKQTSQIASLKNIPISVELEKVRDGLLPLAREASVIFLSKDFANFNGWSDMDSAINGMKSHVQPGATIICPWGELGAVAYREDVGFVRSKSYPPDKVVDTLGAGDTFIGATIYRLSKNESLEQAINFGCRVAGAKVGTRGFDINVFRKFKN